MTEQFDKIPDTGAPELEDIEIALSDGRRVTLPPQITQHIWEEVRAGRVRSPKQFLYRILGIQNEQEELPTGG